MMQDVGRQPFGLNVIEAQLVTDMPSLKAARDKAVGIMSERMEVPLLLARMQYALNRVNEQWFGWPDNLLFQVTQGVLASDAKYIAVMTKAALTVEDRTMQVENVALQGLQRNGVLVRDRVTGVGIFVTNINEGPLRFMGLQGLKVEDWALIRREEIRALIAADDPTDNRSGVLVISRVTGRGMFVTIQPESMFRKGGLQGLVVENWAPLRRQKIATLKAIGDAIDMDAIYRPPLAPVEQWDWGNEDCVSPQMKAEFS